jgi:hypothetical protein
MWYHAYVVINSVWMAATALGSWEKFTFLWHFVDSLHLTLRRYGKHGWLLKMMCRSLSRLSFLFIAGGLSLRRFGCWVEGVKGNEGQGCKASCCHLQHPAFFLLLSCKHLLSHSPSSLTWKEFLTDTLSYLLQMALTREKKPEMGFSCSLFPHEWDHRTCPQVLKTIECSCNGK